MASEVEAPGSSTEIKPIRQDRVAKTPVVEVDSLVRNGQWKRNNGKGAEEQGSPNRGRIVYAIGQVNTLAPDLQRVEDILHGPQAERTTALSPRGLLESDASQLAELQGRE